MAFLIAAFIWTVILLLLIKPGSGKALLVVLLITAGFLVLAAVLLFYGAQTTEPGATTLDSELSVEALRATATLVGAGLITGLVAGTIIAVVQRWHDAL